MQKKKTKTWQAILIVLLIAIAIFIGINLRKVIILKNLNNKINEQIAYKNAHVIIDTDDTNIEEYRLDDITKIIINKKNDNTKITQITTPTKRILYSESEEQKTMSIYPGDGTNEMFEKNQNIIVNYFETYTIGEGILNIVTSSIRSGSVDGRDCYIVSGMHNSNYLYNKNSKKVQIYIDKETGLNLKVVETIDDNGTEKQIIRNLKYDINTVKESDIEELNQDEYTLIEEK